MKEHPLTLPEVMLVAGTRVALGVGLGLLLAGKLGTSARLAAGWSLLAVGLLTTPPLVAHVLSRDGADDADPDRLPLREEMLR
jgi:hypothetical protein